MKKPRIEAFDTSDKATPSLSSPLDSMPAIQPKPPQREQSTSQSINQSTNRLTDNNGGIGIVERPKAFYITKRLDRRLDEAVRYYQEKHGIRKMDRSTIINALLDNDDVWADEALDLMVDRVISQLTKRLTG